MLNKDRWLLPEGVREILSPEARAIEMNRRAILDMYHGCGYDLVQPPLIDFHDSLLTGMGHDLELMTFTVTDQLSGKLLGIRSDMTPQVSRIDAHYIQHDHPSRFCYLGEVLQSRLDGFSQSRCPVQTGAEIYGHNGYQSDLEIIQLMVRTLRLVGVGEMTLDLGHVGIFRCLSQQAELTGTQEEQLFEAIQRKAVTDIGLQLKKLNLSAKLESEFLSLVDLNGSQEILAQAKTLYDYEEIQTYLDTLDNIATSLKQALPDINLFFDLSELRGFNYHTGVVFSAYIEGHGQAIALGGRYDGIGEKFGRSRSATGFSTDLAHLIELTGINESITNEYKGTSIFAPYVDTQSEKEDAQSLLSIIEELRHKGERVVSELKDQAIDFHLMGCNRRLVLKGKQWDVEPISL